MEPQSGVYKPLDRKAENQEVLPELTPRERAVLELLVEGHGKSQVSERLKIGERTVDRILAQLTEKFAEIDPLLGETRGTVGRIARVVALYTARRNSTPVSDKPPARNTGDWPLLRRAVHSELDIGFDQTRNETEIRVECLI